MSKAQKIGTVETAAEFFKRRAGGGKPSDLLPFLDRAADEAPEPNDVKPKTRRERRRSKRT